MIYFPFDVTVYAGLLLLFFGHAWLARGAPDAEPKHTLYFFAGLLTIWFALETPIDTVGNNAAVLVSLRVTQSDTNGNDKPSLPMRWRVVVHQDFDTGKLTAYDMKYPDGGN